MNPQIKSLQDVRALSVSELSLKARIGYVALLLVSAGMTVVIGSLWLTEASLPFRTQVAFAAMCLIGVSWVTLAVWALRSRRPLFARDRVIAGLMAVTFTSMFLVGAISAVVLSGNAASYWVLATAVGMLMAALSVRSGARSRFAALEGSARATRRDQLSPVPIG